MNKKISILLPAYNEEASFPYLKECMDQVLAQNPGYDWEFLLVNDGSTDNTLTQMERLHDADPLHYNYLDLSRNYGKEIAMMAGIDYVTGDALIIMDSDMQHPVSVIPEMIKWWEEGYDDVYATRQSSQEGFFKKNSSKLYYRVLQHFTHIPIQKDTGDFRLLDRSCIDALRRMRETERNTKGLYSWIGFRKKQVFYQQLQRRNGTTKWKFTTLANLAVNGFLSYTTAPLRFASFTGILVGIVALIYLIVVVVKTITIGEPVKGYPTIMATILLLGAFILISLGIIGEYLARIFNEVKSRPGYFVRTYNGNKAADQR